jgi:hypothetical protein
MVCLIEVMLRQDDGPLMRFVVHAAEAPVGCGIATAPNMVAALQKVKLITFEAGRRRAAARLQMAEIRRLQARLAMNYLSSIG